MKRKKLVPLIGMSLLTLGVAGQRGTVAAGGDAFGSTGKVSYSVGQIEYNAISTSSDGAVYQGIQQAYEITDATGISESELSQGITLYPNPASDVLYLKFELSRLVSPRFAVMSVDGKLLLFGEVTQNFEQLNLESLTKGVYLVNVYSSEKLIKSFNLIKN